MTKTVVVAGLGYVGLPLAMRAAQAGYRVIGYDVDLSRVKLLEAGESYIEDVPSGQLTAVLDRDHMPARRLKHRRQPPRRDVRHHPIKRLTVQVHDPHHLTQPRHDRICLADFYRPVGSGEIDVVALQAVTAGEEVTELMAKLEADGEFAEQLFVHGLGVQTAEGMAEWMHSRVRADLGIEQAQGRRYSWGYPACPEQSEHEKVFRLLDAPSIGLRLSGGFAVEPEQSTLAIVAHHPQAVYFGMKSGFLPKTAKQAADELIAGSDRDPARLSEQLSDADPELVDEGEPAMAQA